MFFHFRKVVEEAGRGEWQGGKGHGSVNRPSAGHVEFYKHLSKGALRFPGRGGKQPRFQRKKKKQQACVSNKPNSSRFCSQNLLVRLTNSSQISRQATASSSSQDALTRTHTAPTTSQGPATMPITPSTTATPSRVLVATRIHGQETTAATPFDGAKLRAFLRSAVGYADAVAVAVEVADVFHPRLLVAVQDVAKEFGECTIDVLPVTPWGRFVPALNAALAFAMQRDFSHILFLSLEMDLTPPAFRALFANFDPAEDLVVGAGKYAGGIGSLKIEKEGHAMNHMPLLRCVRLTLPVHISSAFSHPQTQPWKATTSNQAGGP